jgi:hypothetical protein
MHLLSLHDLGKFLELHWLTDVVVHARSQAALAIATQSIRRHSDDARLTFLGQPFADLASRVEPVHLGHQDVHQDQVIGQLRGGIHCLEAVRHNIRSLRQAFQQELRQPLIHHVILGQQDAKRRRQRLA